MLKNARVGPNFDESVLSTRARYFDSVKSSWLPESQILRYSKTKKMTLDPPPVPLITSVPFSLGDHDWTCVA